MSDFVVTAVCPKCSYVWVFPKVFEHHCPSCGTSTPAVDVELLAGRREAMERGERLPPIVAVPEEGTDLMENFTEAVTALRSLITDEVLNSKGEHEDIEQGNWNHEEVLDLEEQLARRQGRLAKLQAIERGVSSLFLVTETAKRKFVRKKEEYLDSQLGKWGVNVSVDAALPRTKPGGNVTIRTMPDGTHVVIPEGDWDREGP